jgi:lycopene beta-cyclase
MKDYKKYDYIIAGSGCSGMSLLYRILNNPVLKSKKILVIDNTNKVTNNRTWCYWEKKDGIFESIVSHRWKSLNFFSTDVSKKLNLQEYTYKMIQGIDFYSFILNFSKDFDNVTFKYENITKIYSFNEKGYILADKSKYIAKYIFNSTNLFNPQITIKNSLLQHFEGWVIKTKESSFDPNIGTLMDLRVDQKHGTTFMYVLPTTKNEALIEHTLFSEKILKKEEYEIELKKYISEYLNINEYEILHKEFGIIPMSLASFERNPKSSKCIINIGTAGGYTKASSGYTFQFIQKNCDVIIKNLLKNLPPNPKKTISDKIFEWYDKTLIQVIISNKMKGRDVFSIMFKKNKVDRILAFLGNESSIKDDIKIMISLPVMPFLSSGLKHLFKSKRSGI